MEVGVVVKLLAWEVNELSLVNCTLAINYYSHLSIISST